jgi:Putative Actinobacterial Holin-X, holin superfamily III
MKHPVPPVREFNAISDLIDDIRSELRLLLKEEVQLAKTEMSEKLSRLKRNLILVVAGAISAYTAVIFLLIGVATLIALGLQATGLSLLLSVGLGAIAVFVLVGAAGYILMAKGVAALDESLMPEKTLQTLGMEVKHDSEVVSKDPHSSDELQRQVERRQELVGQDLDNLKVRLMPKRLFRVFLAEQIKEHPFRLISIAAAATVASFQITRRLLKKSG